MDFLESTQKASKNSPLAIGVLSVPPRNMFVSMPCQSSEYKLLYHSKKKITMAVYRIQLPKSKLFANLEIY